MFTQAREKLSRNKLDRKPATRNKLALIAATGLVTLMLASEPVRANHDHDIVTPLVTGFALGALLNYGHGSHHYYRYQQQRHGHYRSGSGYGYGHGHGHGSHYNKGHYNKKHSSHGHYGHQRRHSSSRGSSHKPRRKH